MRNSLMINFNMIFMGISRSKKKASELNMVYRANKIRKTSSKDRLTYSYEFVAGKKVTLYPDKDGVTEQDIKLLHKLDDSEVYFNNKNLRPNRTRKEKEIIDKWKEEYIRKFKKEYGYNPNKEDINYMVEEKFPRNYSQSIDYED